MNDQLLMWSSVAANVLSTVAALVTVFLLIWVVVLHTRRLGSIDRHLKAHDDHLRVLDMRADTSMLASSLAAVRVGLRTPFPPPGEKR